MRKQCRRKIWSKIDPIQHAITGAAITPDYLLDKLRLMQLSAIDSMVNGNATIDDWRILVDMLNVAEIMAINGIGIELLEVCKIVQKEM